MAWTAPMTFVTATALTAAQLNAHLRDNLLETMAGKAVTPGAQFMVDRTAPIGLEERVCTSASVNQTEATASVTYVDLTNVGPAVTVNTGTRAMIFFSARMYNGTINAQCCMSYGITGVTTSAADDTRMLCVDGLAAANRWHCGVPDFNTALTSGINTFTAKYRAGGAGTAYYTFRRIVVWPM